MRERDRQIDRERVPEDGAVITMETCLKLARLWSQSDVYKRGIMIDILRQYDDKQNS